MCVPWELNPWPFALLTQCSNHWATGTQESFGKQWLDGKFSTSCEANALQTELLPSRWFGISLNSLQIHFVGHIQVKVPRDRALHCSTSVTSYTTLQDHSLSLCLPFIQCLLLSLFFSPFISLCSCLLLFFYFSVPPLSLSGLLTVPPKPTLSARVIDEKGERVQKFNYTDMLVTERERDRGAEKEKQRKKKTAPRWNATHRSAISSPANKRRDYSL